MDLSGAELESGCQWILSGAARGLITRVRSHKARGHAPRGIVVLAELGPRSTSESCFSAAYTMNVHTPLTVARMALIRSAPPAPERTARTLRSIIKRNPLLSLAMVRAACLSSVCVMCALSSGTPCVCACFDADSREHDSGRCCAHDGDLADARPAHPSYRRGTDDESAADGRAPGGTPSSHAGRRSASGRQSCSRPAAGFLVQLKTAQFCSSPRQSRAGG